MDFPFPSASYYGHSIAHSEDEAATKLEELLTPVAVKLLSIQGFVEGTAIYGGNDIKYRHIWGLDNWLEAVERGAVDRE